MQQKMIEILTSKKVYFIGLGLLVLVFLIQLYFLSNQVHLFKSTNNDSQIAGSFTQYPIKLAWAVTIHKGQGQTFDKVIVDFGRGTFAFGQSYVALSRCTGLEGLVLRTPLEQRHIFTDERITEFMEKFGVK